MLSISKKLKVTLLTGMLTASMLGTTLVSAAGPWHHPGPPPIHHHHYYHDNSSNNAVTAFVAGAIIGAVVGHNT
ncbi:hypothetical protein NXG27_01225 [Megasphaera paucivorans]|uniref:Glycine zipper 2TM domain-containing protein n=1 Tax=Megasphaera paucivorans TaxID=349095 RepID=A0A1G9QJZ1_9FIRM|nr:hypothetical protein [Megasphaera paucivorans]SDM10585.1 hypothetical protein SAMN05660299_00246 [Megasphaera paucivorans]